MIDAARSTGRESMNVDESQSMDSPRLVTGWLLGTAVKDPHFKPLAPGTADCNGERIRG